MYLPEIKTLGSLKKSGYIYKSIKDELRQNLIQKLKNRVLLKLHYQFQT